MRWIARRSASAHVETVNKTTIRLQRLRLVKAHSVPVDIPRLAPRKGLAGKWPFDVKKWLKAAYVKLPLETPAEIAGLLKLIAQIEGEQPRPPRA